MIEETAKDIAFGFVMVSIGATLGFVLYCFNTLVKEILKNRDNEG